jgi:hypothetical protein
MALQTARIWSFYNGSQRLRIGDVAAFIARQAGTEDE